MPAPRLTLGSAQVEEPAFRLMRRVGSGPRPHPSLHSAQVEEPGFRLLSPWCSRPAPYLSLRRAAGTARAKVTR